MTQAVYLFRLNVLHVGSLRCNTLKTEADMKKLEKVLNR